MPLATATTRSSPAVHRTRHRRWFTTAWLVVLLSCVAGSVAAAPKTHVVYPGQRLGSIAKRYNVSIEDLCKANGIRRKDPIFPGQKLTIPEPGRPVTAPSPSKQGTSKQAPSKQASSRPKATGTGRPTLHTIASGQTLEGISKRYGVSIDAICHASGITRKSVLRIGQQLVVPATTDPEGRHARSLRLSGRLQEAPSKQGQATWKKYSKAPWRAGYVTIQGYSREWKGYVIGPGQKVLPHAKQEISRVLGVRADGPEIDDRLIRLIAKVSDQFGGRPLRIVSGYRERSYVHDSKHKVGRALDFSIPGVPNEALGDFCRTLGNVGVGYYPNSTFVHLDVRSEPAHWVDYSGPGEPPRLTRDPPRSTARLARVQKSSTKDVTRAQDEAPDGANLPASVAHDTSANEATAHELPPDDSAAPGGTASVDAAE